MTRSLHMMGALVCALTVLPPSLSFADDEVAPLQAKLARDGQQVTASFDVTAAFTDRFRKRVSGGLKSRVLIEMRLLDADGQMVAGNLRECRLRFDIWDDVLSVAYREIGAQYRKRVLLIDKGLTACGRVTGAQLGPLSLLTRGSGYRLQVVVSLNPVSEELLRNTREFLSNPRGTRPGRQRQFFGVVSKFLGSDSAAVGERFMFSSGRLPRPSKVGAN